MVTLPDEFVLDMLHLDSAAIKIFIAFRKLAGEITEEKFTEPVWLNCGYESLMLDAGLGSRTSIRRGIIKLASIGWIIDFKRGFSLPSGKVFSNRYLFSPEKNMSNAADVMVKIQDFESKRNRSQ